MYSLVTWGKVLTCLTLCQAYRELQRAGRGAIFRGSPTTYAKPVYPLPSTRR
jgi:hypothetical protein